jgi:putative aldouronate transport system substrate-binding protein
MKKKTISILCLLTIAASMFAGCAKSDSKTVKTDDKSSATPTEINVMVWDRGNNKFSDSSMTVTNNALTKYISEQVLTAKNVKVNFVSVARSGSDDKVNAMMAGGNAPDLILSYNRDIFGNFATQGGLTDLTALLASDGPNISKYIGKSTLDVGVLDGKQYAIMTRRGIQVPRHNAYIRKDWLDKLGLPVPTTTQQLIDALYAFKQKDPGGLGDKNIPWGMGGVSDTEKFYLSFVNQYVTKPYEGENLWVYQEAQAALNPQAKAGFQVMNKLYNDGIISKDFAVDTKSDKYKSDISNGYVGFVLEDTNGIYSNGWIDAAKKKVPNIDYVALNAFTGVNNEYKNVAEPTYGSYIMVPKKSEAKAKAVVKYLDWLADPANAEKVVNSPTFTRDKDGLPVGPTEEERIAKNYPATLDDFNILNKHLSYMDDDAKIIASYASWMKEITPQQVEAAIKTSRKGMVVYPVQQQILPNSSKYGKAVQDAAVQFSYKVISAPANQFESMYTSEYQKVVQAGFDKILKEKQDYYNQKVKK